MKTPASELTYFGIPGVCFDVDGDWWHEPGSVKVDPAFDRWLHVGGPMPAPNPRPCCGTLAPRKQETP